MKTVFKSLNRDGIAYIYDEESTHLPIHFYRAIMNYVGQECYEFVSYNNDLTSCNQGTLVFRVHFVDFYMSLAHHLINNPPKKAPYHIFQQINPDTIKFLTKIKYKKDKRQFFNLTERKLSKAKSKEFDKRYQEVPEGFDGSSVEDIFRIVKKEYWNIGDYIAVIRQIREILNWVWFDTEKTLGVNTDHWREMDHIVHIIQDLTESYRLQETAISRLKIAKKQYKKEKES